MSDLLHELFVFSVSPVELIVRGTAVYWFLFAIFRFILRRDVGSIVIADVLLLVIIADASQNAMAGEYKTVSDGWVLVSTIVGWNYLIDWAAYRFAFIRKVIEPPLLLLVRDGQLLRRNMRKEFISKEDLMAELRKLGIVDLADVHKAYMEGDGSISVIRVGETPLPLRKRKKSVL